MFDFLFKHKPAKVGLVLGGGAARGIAHVGVVKVLAREQVPVKMIIGTSAGAIIGSLYAAGFDAGQIERASQAMNLFKMVFPSFNFKGLNNSEVIAKYLEPYLGGKTFADLKLPMYVVATDLKTGKEKIFSSGSVIKALQASCSYPVLYTPAKIDKEHYIDGGFADNLPVRAMQDLGADFTIAVDVIPKVILTKEPQDAVTILNRAQDILLRRASNKDRQRADVLIEPVVENILSFEIMDQKKLIALGEEAAERAIPEIKRKLGLNK
ncbi:MAG: patatin-like phospholipase family protein [Candidatus Margulisiibacteriota bacterium]|jgi:NTE family protein